MRQLRLPWTSEALREGIRLLFREAAEFVAAEDIRRFNSERPAPLRKEWSPRRRRNWLRRTRSGGSECRQSHADLGYSRSSRNSPDHASELRKQLCSKP